MRHKPKVGDVHLLKPVLRGFCLPVVEQSRQLVEDRQRFAAGYRGNLGTGFC